MTELRVVHTEGNEDDVPQGVECCYNNERCEGKGIISDWFQKANSLLVKDFQQWWREDGVLRREMENVRILKIYCQLHWFGTNYLIYLDKLFEVMLVLERGFRISCESSCCDVWSPVKCCNIVDGQLLSCQAHCQPFSSSEAIQVFLTNLQFTLPHFRTF